jgi:hypothetical protein
MSDRDLANLGGSTNGSIAPGSLVTRFRNRGRSDRYQCAWYRRARTRAGSVALGDLQLNDPILQTWRDGVTQLKQKPASGAISWASFAAIHGNASGFNLCPHGNWYFLPWHRAFLLMYERTVRHGASASASPDRTQSWSSRNRRAEPRRGCTRLTLNPHRLVRRRVIREKALGNRVTFLMGMAWVFAVTPTLRCRQLQQSRAQPWLAPRPGVRPSRALRANPRV